MTEKDLVIRAAVLRDEWAKQQDWTGVTQTAKTEMCCSKIYELYQELKKRPTTSQNKCYLWENQ